MSFISLQRLGATVAPEKQRRFGAVGLIYRCVAVFLSILWVFRYIADEHLVWVFALAGAVSFVVTNFIKSPELFAISGLYTGVAFLQLWARFGGSEVLDWANLLVILALLAQQAFAQRRKDAFRHEVSDGEVAIGRSETARETGGALSEGWIRVK